MAERRAMGDKFGSSQNWLILADALTRLKPAEAASEVAKALGLPRRDLYRRAMEMRAKR